MSLKIGSSVRYCGGFPRVSGDEPARKSPRQAGYVFSPRERG